MDKPRLVGLEFTEDGKIGNQVVMDLDEPGEFLEIPLYPNKEKKEEKEEPVNPDDVIRARMEEVWYK